MTTSNTPTETGPPSRQPENLSALRRPFGTDRVRSRSASSKDLSLLYASVDSIASMGSMDLFQTKDISTIFASSDALKLPPLTASTNPFASIDAAVGLLSTNQLGVVPQVYASLDPMPLKSLDMDTKTLASEFQSREWCGLYEQSHTDIDYLGLFKSRDALPTKRNKWEEVYLAALEGPKPHELVASPEPTKTVQKKKKKSTTRRNEPKDKIYVEPLPQDIISGRGGKSNAWEGNLRYREVVEESKPAYNAGDKFYKTIKSQEVVDLLLNEGRRFLKLDESGPRHGEYYIMTKNQARKKAGQALREENTPESRKRKREFYAKKKN